MNKSQRIFAVLLVVIAVCWAAGSCGSFSSFEDPNSFCFGCTQFEPFSRTYLFSLVAAGGVADRATYFAYDSGLGAAGHRTFNIIKLYDQDTTAFTAYIVSGNGPKGSGSYEVRVVPQQTPHVNTDGVFDVSGF